MEDYSNFESSSTDVPGNYPEVLMTEGQGNLLKGIDNKTVKVNSVQEAGAKCFAVHILTFEILQST